MVPELFLNLFVVFINTVMNYNDKLETIFEKDIKLDTGDIVYTGKFRNRPTKVTGFGEDEGQPTVKLARINKKTDKAGKSKETKLLKFKLDNK